MINFEVKSNRAYSVVVEYLHRFNIFMVTEDNQLRNSNLFRLLRSWSYFLKLVSFIGTGCCGTKGNLQVAFEKFSEAFQKAGGAAFTLRIFTFNVKNNCARLLKRFNFAIIRRPGQEPSNSFSFCHTVLCRAAAPRHFLN